MKFGDNLNSANTVPSTAPITTAIAAKASVINVPLINKLPYFAQNDCLANINVFASFW